MPTVSVNGIKLHYESTGSGHPVVFVHGLMGTTEAWKPQVDALSRSYRFITYDARGHGRTASPSSVDQYSSDIVAEDLHQLLKALEVERAAVGGLSLGGSVALRFAIQHPEMVSALIVMDTGPGFRNPERVAEWNKSQEERAQLVERDGVLAFADRSPQFSWTPRETLAKFNPTGVAHTIRRIVGQYDYLIFEGLPKVKAPTLVVVGERDKMFLQSADYIANAIPGARKVVIPNAGHACNIDNPPVFNREVLDFLDGLKLK